MGKCWRRYGGCEEVWGSVGGGVGKVSGECGGEVWGKVREGVGKGVKGVGSVRECGEV